jgi:hypothetical protein
MGLKVFKITGERQAVALVCDRLANCGGARTAWFDGGSHSGSLSLAKAVGWIESRGGPGVWLCPHCAHGRDQKAVTTKSRSKPHAPMAWQRQLVGG